MTAITLALAGARADAGDIAVPNDDPIAKAELGAAGAHQIVLFGNHAPGDLAGTIVDLSCDSVRPSGGNIRCDVGEHYYALKVDGQSALLPLLLLGSPPSVERLRAGDFTGRKVRIDGVHHTSTGTIVVSEVHPLG